MPLYSKDGSYPKPQTDGTNGWIQVLDPPTEIPEGKELRWLNWEWVVRDPKPEDRPGWQWNWKHDTKEWVEWEYMATAGELVEPPINEVEPPVITVPTASAAISDEFAIYVPDSVEETSPEGDGGNAA